MKYPQIFKPEDFVNLEHAIYNDRTKESAADFAQQIFESYLREHGKVVYGVNTGNWDELNIMKEINTHTALLVCIEPISKPKCEHHQDKILSPNESFDCYRCSGCGAFLKPNWEVLK